MDISINKGDCLDIMQSIASNSLDACVTDPPYGLGTVKDPAGLLISWIQGTDHSQYIGKSGFMGKEWDKVVPRPEIWREVYRVLKPGAYALVFAGTRTADLMGMSLRLAGFTIRDQISYHYVSGFPKSLNVSKQIDRQAGAKREQVGEPVRHHDIRNGHGRKYGSGMYGGEKTGPIDIYKTVAATDLAKQWEGYGSALKPSSEPIIVCQKPLEGTITENVLKWGTGALNIDGCRIPTTRNLGATSIKGPYSTNRTWRGGTPSSTPGKYNPGSPLGAWPNNAVFCHAPECEEWECVDGCPVDEITNQCGKDYFPTFFFGSKAGAKERNAGLDHLETSGVHRFNEGIGEGYNPRLEVYEKNIHPTVKPISLMRWLVRLVGHPGATILDPFAGSGTTGVAAEYEGMHAILCELGEDERYIPIIEGRVAHAQRTIAKEAEFTAVSLWG